MSAGSLGTGDADQTWSVPGQPPEPAARATGPDNRTQAVLGLRVAAVLVLLGALVGVVWRMVAPVAQVRIESQGGYFVDPDPEQFIAADAVFAGLSLLAGVVAGIVVWRLVRRAPTAAVLALAIGGLAGAFMAREIGQLLGHTDSAAVARLPVGSIVPVSLRLEAGAALLVLPVAAVGAWLVADLVSDALAARAARAADAGFAGAFGAAGPHAGPDAGAGLSPDAPPEPPQPTSA